MLRGQWSEAEQEARQACEELERFRLMFGVGYAHYFVGEVRLRMGDLDAAGEAFERAYEYGHDAQPGRAPPAGAWRGRPGTALDRPGTGDCRRQWRAGRSGDAGPPPAGAGQHRDRRRRPRDGPSAVDELDAIAADYERPLFEAGALTARGELLLGEDKPAEASPLLGRSWRIWQATDLPYEAARARLHFAEALAAEGDPTAAQRDLRAARTAFERLGATLDLQRVDALLGDDQRLTADPTRHEDVHVH